MANQKQVDLLKNSVEVWNKWREDNLEIRPDLSEANLSNINLSNADLHEAELYKADLTNANIQEANLVDANLFGANLQGAILNNTDLYNADFTNANLRYTNFQYATLIRARFVAAFLTRANLTGADLRDTNLHDSDLQEADLRKANLSGSDLRRANLQGANLHEADLSESILVETKLNNANISGCNIYGISAWNTTTDEKTIQTDLVITKKDESIIKVDNLEVAQFIYLLLDNKKLRDTIDTICKKVVLVLGRFTDERKPILEGIKEALRKYGYTPILFDFEKPESKSFIETVLTLANMSRFIIADFTDEKIVLHETSQILNNTTLPILPLKTIGQFESVTMLDLRYEYNNKFLDTCWYENRDYLYSQFEQKIIKPAEEAVINLAELRLKIYKQEGK